MDIRNCKRCGNIFQYSGKSICTNCNLQDDEDYKTIREYIVKHPNSSSLDISDGAKIELKTITRFLREGRLESEAMDISDSGLQCEKCNRDISTGRYCDACLNELQEGFQAASRQLGAGIEKAKPRESVHTYDNILKKKN